MLTTSTTYEETLNKARLLTMNEQLKLLEELAALVRQQLTARSKHKITEFKGLGKEIWGKVDVEKYINEERDSWDG